MAALNIAASGSTLTALPLTTSKPSGWFIQPLALITKNADAAELTTRGIVHSQCALGESRYRTRAVSAPHGGQGTVARPRSPGSGAKHWCEKGERVVNLVAQPAATG